MERTPEEGARLIALQLLDAATNAAQRLSDASDEEALHDFRTALRRLRSTLRAYRPWLDEQAHRAEKKLSKVSDLTGQGRDAEVHLEWVNEQLPNLEGGELKDAKWLGRLLEKEKDAGYSRARDDARKAFTGVQKSLRRALRTFEREVDADGTDRPSYRAATGKILRELGQEISKRFGRVDDRYDVKQLHKARILAKRLRYALEPLGESTARAEELVGRIKKLQDVLGNIHDLHVLDARLEALIGEHDRSGLASLRRVVDAKLRPAFRTLEKSWFVSGWQQLRQEIDAFADELEGAQQSGPPSEIERKYLLKGRPDRVTQAESKEIDQGWLPGEKLQERLRRVKTRDGERFLRTVKLGRGIKRIEVEEEADPALFEKLWSLTEGKRVQKRRYEVPDGERTWEIDEFLDRELWLAEIELPSEDAEVVIPDWLAPHVEREVTGEDEYVNVNLAR